MSKLKMFFLLFVLLSPAFAFADCADGKYKDCRCSLAVNNGFQNVSDVTMAYCCDKGCGGMGYDGDPRCCSQGTTWDSVTKTCKAACGAYTCGGNGAGGWVAINNNNPVATCTACCNQNSSVSYTGTLSLSGLPQNATCGGTDYITCFCKKNMTPLFYHAYGWGAGLTCTGIIDSLDRYLRKQFGIWDGYTENSFYIPPVGQCKKVNMTQLTSEASTACNTEGAGICYLGGNCGTSHDKYVVSERHYLGCK